MTCSSGSPSERQEMLDRYQLGDVLSDIREELEAIVDTERRGIERRMAESGSSDRGRRGAATHGLRDGASAARSSSTRCRTTPGGRIRGLQEYDFLEPSARATASRSCSKRLRKQVLDSWFQGLSDAIQDVTPEQLAANREMVRDLNRLLEERLEGDEPSQDRVDAFLAQHGQFFPGAKTLDDIVEQLAERMAAMQSLLASMSPQQRERAAIDDGLAAARRPAALGPGAAGVHARPAAARRASASACASAGTSRSPWTGRSPRWRSCSAWIASPSSWSTPATPVRWRTSTPTRCGDLLDAESAQDLEALQRPGARSLEDAGYVERNGEDLELTARGTRRLGQRVLDELFAKLRRDAFGGHAIRRSGQGGERAEESTAWEFGRPFHLDLQRTLSNAMTREENATSVRRGAAKARDSCWTRRTSRSSRPRSSPTPRPCCSWT